ncbi:hypothetical protein HT031_004916 [Scenedesmus sp. PABB004]|nr:hypothetical protein HT031_004916 [Scenedesmus sp. PABB004]
MMRRSPPARGGVVARFLPALRLPQLAWPLPGLGAAPRARQAASQAASQARLDQYASLLQKAECATFAGPPEEQRLADGERLLGACIAARPRDLAPRVVQACNFMRAGRERDVPAAALQALQDSGVHGCDLGSPSYVQVLQVVLLGLKALHKLEADGVAATPPPRGPAATRASFLAAAQRAVPGMAADMAGVAERLHRTLVCCGPEQRARLLADRDGFMCSVDLQVVWGQHHAHAVERSLLN